MTGRGKYDLKTGVLLLKSKEKLSIHLSCNLSIHKYVDFITKEFLNVVTKNYTETIILYEYKLSVQSVQFSLYHKV